MNDTDRWNHECSTQGEALATSEAIEVRLYGDGDWVPLAEAAFDSGYLASFTAEQARGAIATGVVRARSFDAAKKSGEWVHGGDLIPWRVVGELPAVPGAPEDKPWAGPENGS